MQVAIIEDSPEQGRHLSRLFESCGTTAEVFASGQKFLHRIRTTTFDLATLDLQLPDMNGLELLRQLQAERALFHRGPPVMIVSGHHDLAIMKTAFSNGAYDFISKPFRPDELMIRAEAIARRHQPNLFSDQPISVQGIDLNLATLQAFCDGQEVPLSAKEFRLAWLLFHRRGQTVTRSHIMKLIWGRSDWPNSRTLDTHIGRIRQKLCLESRPGLRLQPVYGVGYRLDVFP